GEREDARVRRSPLADPAERTDRDDGGEGPRGEHARLDRSPRRRGEAEPRLEIEGGRKPLEEEGREAMERAIARRRRREVGEERRPVDREAGEVVAQVVGEPGQQARGEARRLEAERGAEEAPSIAQEVEREDRDD